MKDETFELIVKQIDEDNRDIIHDVLKSEGELLKYVTYLENSYYSIYRINLTLECEKECLEKEFNDFKKEILDSSDENLLQESISSLHQTYFNQVCNICIDTVLKAPYDVAVAVLSAFSSLYKFNISFKTERKEGESERKIVFMAFRYLSFERDWTSEDK